MSSVLSQTIQKVKTIYLIVIVDTANFDEAMNLSKSILACEHVYFLCMNIFVVKSNLFRYSSTRKGRHWHLNGQFDGKIRFLTRLRLKDLLVYLETRAAICHPLKQPF